MHMFSSEAEDSIRLTLAFCELNRLKIENIFHQLMSCELLLEYRCLVILNFYYLFGADVSSYVFRWSVERNR